MPILPMNISCLCMSHWVLLATALMFHRIDRLALESPVDELMIRRLKKRRLGLRDQIMRLEHLVYPDATA